MAPAPRLRTGILTLNKNHRNTYPLPAQSHAIPDVSLTNPSHPSRDPRTQEYVNGQLKNKYGDAFIRGNNVCYISTVKDK